MNQLIRGFFVLILLVGGYAVLCVVGLAAMVFLGSFMANVVGWSIQESTLGLIGLAVGAVAFTVFLFRQKSVRAGFSEFWDQIRRNL